MSVSIVIFLQILFLVIIIIDGERTFDCTGYEDDSYHPIYDAGDCRHYWHCIYVNTVYMHAVKRVCPAGTEFDPTLRKCETSSLVDCIPQILLSMPKKTSTTKVWKWKYSKLLSRKHWKTTRPLFMKTRQHRIFNIGNRFQYDFTTRAMAKTETAKQIPVLPMTLSKSAVTFSLEKLSKDLHNLLLNSHASRRKSIVTKFFQPGNPSYQAIAYKTIIKQQTNPIRFTTQSTPLQTSTQLPLTTLFLSTDTMATTMTTAVPVFFTMTTTEISSLIPTSITTVTTQPEIISLQKPRITDENRRHNMTLYILTSGENKIRRFSINHTRGFLINCNQLRNRLLGRRRLRDVPQTTTINNSFNIENSSALSIRIFQCNILSLTILSFFVFLQK